MDVIGAGFRIKQAIGFTGYNVKEFCEKVNRSRVTTALWITGRGGIIKENNLDDLCHDLLKCNVLCNTRWILEGKGKSPTLIGTDNKDIENNKNLTLRLNYNLDEITKLLSYLPQSNLFEVNTEERFVIALKITDTAVKSLKSELCLIQLLNRKKFILGIIEGICKESKHLIIRQMDKSFSSIDMQQVKQIGKVILMLAKK